MRLSRKLTTVHWKAIQAAAPSLFPSRVMVRRDTGAPAEREAVDDEPPAAKRLPALDADTDAALGVLLGARAHEILLRDPLVEAKGIVEVLAGDPEVRSLLGAGRVLTLGRYEKARAARPSLFPDLRDPSRPLAILAEEIRALLASTPSLTLRELAERMRAVHPSFKLARLKQLGKAYPGLLTPVAPTTLAPEQRRADADRVLALQKEDPALTAPALAARLGEAEPRFTKDYVDRLRGSYKALFAGTARPYASRAVGRPARMVDELVRLAVLMSPPATREEEIVAATNRLLESRGLEPISGTTLHPSIRDHLIVTHGSLDAQGAAEVGELVAEYARSAKKGASQAEILAAVQKDYPQISNHRIGAFRRQWRSDPARHPALTAFLDGEHELALRGLGQRVTSPRFLGGWDPRRALRGADSQALARSLDYARITTELPLVDVLVDGRGGKKPLQHKTVMMVSHLLGSTVALTRALAAAGATQKGMIVVGTPYGSNEAFAETLRGEGVDVRVPTLSEAAYREHVIRAVDDAAARQRRTHEPVIVLDDGGLVAEILHGDPKYADVISQFKIVEQTTRGITVAQKLQLKTPIVNVARSESKLAEGEIIGRTVAEKVAQGLARAGGTVNGKRIVVTGYGTIGAPLVELLVKLGARVAVIDTGADAVLRAKAAGVEVVGKAALADADMVIGATGVQSLSLAELGLLKDGAIVASASSKQVELDMRGLQKLAKRREDITPTSTRAKLPTVRYTLGARRITVLGDGWPINFDGDVDSAPPEEIQITRAAMFAGALQAVKIDSRAKASHDILPLDQVVGRMLVDRFRTLRKAKAPPPISDPDAWPAQLEHLITLVEH